MKQEETTKLLESHLQQLGEHFDSVQIFATVHEPEAEGGTVHICMGNGSWYARYGQVQEWLIRQDEMTRIKARRDERGSDWNG
jgi:hypothetical protein